MEQSLCFFTRLPELTCFPENVIASLSGSSTPSTFCWDCIIYTVEVLYNHQFDYFQLIKKNMLKQVLGTSVRNQVGIWVMAQWPAQGVSLPPADRWEKPLQPPSDPDVNRKWIDSAPFSFFFFLNLSGFSHKYYRKNFHTNWRQLW